MVSANRESGMSLLKEIFVWRRIKRHKCESSQLVSEGLEEIEFDFTEVNGILMRYLWDR